MTSRMMHTARVVAVSSVAACTLLFPTLASATLTASETVTGNTLAFVVTPGNITFPGTTLSGIDQTQVLAVGYDVGDATGSGAGWNITANSTQFTSTSNTLPTTAVTIPAKPAVSVCDASTTCTVVAPADNVVGYPYALPTTGATKMYSAATNKGLGDQTATATWQIAIPANTIASATPYTSTWTISLVSAP